MKNLEKIFNNHKKNKVSNIPGILLALGLILGSPNFSYSKSTTNTGEKIEQIYEKSEKGINEYKKLIETRDNIITTKTTETLDDFAKRMELNFVSMLENGEIIGKICEIRGILDKKYNINIDNNPVKTLKAAFSVLSNTEKYNGLETYNGSVDEKFDTNFLNGFGFIQYMNDFPTDYKLSTNFLNTIINDLSDDNNVNKYSSQGNSNLRTQTNGSATTTVVSTPTSQADIPTRTSTNSNNNSENIINPINDTPNTNNYNLKLKNRDNTITTKTTETLDDFAKRMELKFLFDFDKDNSLLAKKTGNIKDLLNTKFGKSISGNNPVIILQSALEIIANIEDYNVLKQYTNKFSGNFDINFINAYGYIQDYNDLDCNRNLSGESGKLILQDIFDILSTVGNANQGTVTKNNSSDPNSSNDLNRSNNVGNDSGDSVHELNPEYSEYPVNPEIKINNDNNIINSNINLLSQHLSLNQLNGVSYEDVRNMVDGINHDGLKNAVMECLLRNDVIGAQRLLGMELNCNRSRYPNYVASRKLGQRELDLMTKYGQTRRYMDKDEILKYMEKVERAYEIENYEVKTIYLKFVSGELNNGGLPYCIISKYDYKIYLFSADHKLLSCQPVLTGAHIGNHPNNPMGGYHTTPKGMYEVGGVFDKSSEGKNLISVYGTDYILLLPKEKQYNYSEEYSMGIHGYVTGRERRLLSQNTIDRRVSNGCINMDRVTIGELINLLKIGSKIYICGDDE